MIMDSSYICKSPTEIYRPFYLKKNTTKHSGYCRLSLFIFYELTQIFRPQQHITCNFIVLRGSTLYNEQKSLDVLAERLKKCEVDKKIIVLTLKSKSKQKSSKVQQGSKN